MRWRCSEIKIKWISVFLNGRQRHAYTALRKTSGGRYGQDIPLRSERGENEMAEE